MFAKTIQQIFQRLSQVTSFVLVNSHLLRIEQLDKTKKSTFSKNKPSYTKVLSSVLRIARRYLVITIKIDS